MSTVIFYPEARTYGPLSLQRAPNECTSSIEALKAQINFSPFIVCAKLGPEIYTDAPFKLKDKVDGISVYGWKSGSSRNEGGPKCLFVLGAEIRDEKELVYYASAQHDRSSNFRRNPTDEKVYVVTLKRFQEAVTQFGFPDKETLKPFTPPLRFSVSFSTPQEGLTFWEKLWFTKFLEFPIKSILNERKEECKALAQQAFDSFKQQSGGNSLYAKESLVHICDAMRNNLETYPYYGHLLRAWRDVGDDTVKWEP